MTSDHERPDRSTGRLQEGPAELRRLPRSDLRRQHVREAPRAQGAALGSDAFFVFLEDGFRVERAGLGVGDVESAPSLPSSSSVFSPWS